MQTVKKKPIKIVSELPKNEQSQSVYFTSNTDNVDLPNHGPTGAKTGRAGHTTLTWSKEKTIVLVLVLICLFILSLVIAALVDLIQFKKVKK
jgi:hypothetical protein